MAGIPVKPAVIAELQRQMNHEMGAAQSYLALAVWCDDQNWKGFSRHFHKQCGEEREHAARFMKHLLDRNILPELRAIEAPRGNFANLMEIAQHALALEQANTMGVNSAYEVAVREKDFAAQVMLQWFITEQVEEEDWTQEMVDRVIRANCAGGLSDLDRHIERYLEDEPTKAE